MLIAVEDRTPRGRCRCNVTGRSVIFIVVAVVDILVFVDFNRSGRTRGIIVGPPKVPRREGRFRNASRRIVGISLNRAS